jgi:hypothetical protein
MKKTGFRRACALALALVLAMSVLSIAAFAEDPAPSTEAPAATPLETLQKTLTDAQTALAEAQTALAAAQSAYDAAASALPEKAEWVKAEAAAMTAEETLAGAQASQDTAAVAAAQTALDDAKAREKDAHNAYTQAAAKLDEGTALQEAQKKVDDAQAAANAAQAALDQYNKDLAQPVIDAINAIAASGFTNDYKTKTDAQKKAVTDARAAYDALSDAAKAQVSNYADLTAAESYLTSTYGQTRWTMAAAPRTYTTTTGVQVTIDRDKDENLLVLNNSNKVYAATLTVEIPAGASGDLDINLWDALGTVFADMSPLMPGDRLIFNVRVINHSAHAYAYQPKSLTVSDMDLSGITNEVYDCTTEAIQGLASYTGKPICTYGTVFRNVNSALGALNCTTTTTLTDEALGAALKGAGYAGGIADLANYYVDYYNRVFKTDCRRLSDFTDQQLSQIFNGDFPDGVSTNTDLISETNEEVSETGYDFMYNVCTRFGVTKYSGMDGLTYADVSSMSAAGVTQSYGAAVGNGELDSAMSDLTVAAGSTVNSKVLYYNLDFYMTMNSFQYLIEGLSIGMQLKQTDSDVTVSKTDAASGAALSGATFNLYRMVNGAKEYLTDTAGALAWTADQTAATVFTAGSFTVKSLPFGTYYLSELTAPSGYDKRTSDAEIVVDKTAETFAITNSQTPSGGGDDDDDDTPVPPVKPEEPTVIPETPTPEAPAPVTPATEIPEAAVSLRKKRDGE